MSTSVAQHYVYQRRYALIVTKGHYSPWRWGCPLSMAPHYRKKDNSLLLLKSSRNDTRVKHVIDFIKSCISLFLATLEIYF